MIVVHALWSGGRLCLWGEDGDRLAKSRARAAKPVDFSAPRARKHPHACDASTLDAAFGGEHGELILELPTTVEGPELSSVLRRFDAAAADAHKPARKPQLFPWKVPVRSLDPSEALDFLVDSEHDVHFGESVAFFSTVAQFALGLVANGRVLPALTFNGEDHEARWRPVLLSDDSMKARQLERAIPPLCRAVRPAAVRTAAERRAMSVEDVPIVRGVVEAIVDAAVRKTLGSYPLLPVSRRKPTPLRAWLDALSSQDALVAADPEDLESLAVEVDEWRRGAVSASRDLRTCFRLAPPPDDAADEEPDAPWLLEVMVQSVRDPSILVPASQVWFDNDLDELLVTDDIAPHEVLLRDLGRASRLYSEIDWLLEEAQPDVLELDTTAAVDFLQEAAPQLERAGFGVLLPSWWGSKRARLNARLTTKSKSSSSAASGLLGMNALVDYQWEVSLGDDKMTARDLQRLAALKRPLVRVRGEWVLLNEADLEAALAVMKGRKSGGAQMTAGDALRIGLGLQDAGIGLPVTDIESNGWLGELLSADDHRLEAIETPTEFEAELRPYQKRGLSWLGFHDRLGLGACLADDMGLGKTAQFLALLEHERERREQSRRRTESSGPTLVICPMSLVGNWQREAERFAPKLRVHVHHGAGRVSGENFVDAASESDLVITTYQLAARDQELLEQVDWYRVALDEAQNIKNSESTQSRAVRALPSARRVALTGTPVENRLSELWSIMEFLNPGLLGTSSAFRKKFANPIERDNDEAAAERLKRMTTPFVLRRVKTDRSIISDLPEKLEIKTYCNLTREQASLYQAVVDDMLEQIDKTEGIKRKGLVLSTMLRLKQVCNHPAQFLGDGSSLPRRSGKLERLEEIVDEVLADGERMLVFTQFAEMGTMLQAHLQSRIGGNVAWLHGGVPKKKRDAMVEQFQSGEGPSVFLLSLKAGGTGLTLTAANHVVHFDRWWNPAVENEMCRSVNSSPWAPWKSGSTR
jgi:SNF2 family DNA or RNA helicase